MLSRCVIYQVFSPRFLIRDEQRSMPKLWTLMILMDLMMQTREEIKENMFLLSNRHDHHLNPGPRPGHFNFKLFSIHVMMSMNTSIVGERHPFNIISSLANDKFGNAVQSSALIVRPPRLLQLLVEKFAFSPGSL